MQCEICGSEGGRLKTITMDGTEMKVCENCAKFGIEKESPPLAKPKKLEFEKFAGTDSSTDFDAMPSLKKDFGRIVRQAREKQKLTFEELGKKIFESPSVLKRIESEKMVPSDRLIGKLEKALEIKLTE